MRRKIEKAVPACPIPIHHTKFTISHPHATELFTPQVPIPLETVIYIAYPPKRAANVEIPKAIYHHKPGLVSRGLIISFEI
jgi:hypothetical protein